MTMRSLVDLIAGVTATAMSMIVGQLRIIDHGIDSGCGVSSEMTGAKKVKKPGTNENRPSG